MLLSASGKGNGLVPQKRRLHSDRSIELQTLDRSQLRGKEVAIFDGSTEDASSWSADGSRAEHKQTAVEGDVEMVSLHLRAVLAGEEKKGDSDLHVVSQSHPSATLSEDSESSRAEGEELQADSAKKATAIVRGVAVQMITSPFPAPLPLFHPLVHSESKQRLSQNRDPSEKKEGEEDPQVFLIDHSHISTFSLRSHTRLPTQDDAAALRHQRAAARWRAAITAVLLQGRDHRRQAPHSRQQEMFVIRGAAHAASSSSSSPPARATFAGPEAPEPVFVLKKRTGPALAAEAKTVMGGAPRAGQRPTSPPPKPRLTSQLLRRPSISLSSSLAPMDSMQSEVSVLSYDSESSSPRSCSQSHFVIPPAALRHETPAAYFAAHRKEVAAQSGVTLVLSEELARSLCSNSSDGSSSSEGGSDVSQ